MATGIAALALAVFLSFNLVTSCTARAQSNGLCGCSPCTHPAGGVGKVLPLIGTWATGTAYPIVVANLTAYFTTTMVGTELALVYKNYQVAKNVDDFMKTFWWYNLRPAMQSWTDQWQVIGTEQVAAVGRMLDAAEFNRENERKSEEEIRSRETTAPSENACVAGTITGGLTRATVLRKAYARAAPLQALPRGGNARGTTAAQGAAAEQKAQWQKYVDRYCDASANGGSSGCAANAPFAGRDIDIAGEIFNKSTIDLNNADNKRIIDDMIEQIVEPRARNNVAGQALQGSQGQEAVLKGQAYRSQRQALHDSLHYIVSRRLSGSNMAEFLRPMREAAGIDPSLISANPSYNEVMQVLLAERFRTGQYSVERVDNPDGNLREMVIQQGAMAMHLSDYLDLLDRYSVVLAAQAGAEVATDKPVDSKIENRPTIK